MTVGKGMTTHERIFQAVFLAVDELNQQLAADQQVDKAPDTVLLGKAASLDSIGLVSLIVGAEEKVGDEFGTTITLADDRAMSQKKSPFRTIGTLVDYIFMLLEEQGHV